MRYERFTLDRSTRSLWRVTFQHAPINLIDSVLIAELRELFTDIEEGSSPAVIVFDSADPDYFLAHYDISNENRVRVNSLPLGRTGFHPWLEVLVRLSRLPAVTISAIRGRARGAGSEFALATDIRFASRERAVLGQFEIGIGAIPGGGPASRLPGLVGRGRALEILVGGEDFDAALAERYGYVNRAIPDEEFDNFIDRFARRVAAFDRQALLDIKHFVNRVSLPNDEEFPPQMEALRRAVSRPEQQARTKALFELGFQQRSDVELKLGEYIERITDSDETHVADPHHRSSGEQVEQ